MIQTQIKNALIFSSSPLSYKQYAPRQYEDRQHQYFDDESRVFNEVYAKYASDYVEAEIQGLDPEQPFEYTKVHIRYANLIKPSGALSNEFDNYKNIMIAEKPYSYMRRGAKVKTMGNTWLIINPNNASEGGMAVMQKCDAVWNYLDYYGNVCSEPLAIDKLLKRANTPDSQRSTMITKGYFNALVQYNEATQQLFENSRIILGSGAYIITGFSDFQREFTDEENSVNLLEFSLRYEEPNDALDDMKNHVAGGKTFSWDISIGGDSSVSEGETIALTASSVRTNGGLTESVSSTEEYPVDYIWESSNEEIATVDSSGNVTGVSEGEATITVYLSQNQSIFQERIIKVSTVDSEPHVSFESTYPDELQYNRSITFEATYYEEGHATDETITWSVSGADEERYSFKISAEDSNKAVLTCWGGSVEPAVVTAACRGYSVSHRLYLTGI